MNPFELARAELCTPWELERVFAAIDRLLREGFEIGGMRYRLFGARRGHAFNLSLGLPLLGGGAAVLRGRVRERVQPLTLDVSVGGRYQLVLFGWFWFVVIVGGGGYQLLLQLRRVFAGEAAWSAVAEVVPGIALVAGIVGIGFLSWRRRQLPRALALIEQLRLHLDASHPSEPLLPPRSESRT